MRRKNWNIKSLSEQAKEIGIQYNISPFLAQIFLNRNSEASDIPSFLNPSLTCLYSPHLLPDMEKAVTRIKKAVIKKEKILIFGDYDVDGIASLAIFYEFIKEYPGLFSFHIPHRVKDGYGLNEEVIRKAKEDSVKLIIAFDCGTGAYSEISLANSLGLDVVVVDHHHLKTGENNLKACAQPLAFINPKRKDSTYPFLDLSAAALSFKLLQALTSKPCHEVLDLVALSLVCDVVPLKGENRILLKEGLKALRVSSRPAIRALCQASGIRQENIEAFHIAFILGPRLNASGRVAYAHESLDIFLTKDIDEAKSIANKLKEYNQLRRDIEAEILREAEAIVERDYANSHAIVVHNDGWHPGVLGIVASRLADRYYRPSFVISFDEGVGKGSGRSIHSVHLIEMLEECSGLLQGYGGHKKAAGIQIAKEEVEAFRKKINSLIEENIKAEDLIPILDIDARISFSDINMNLVEELALLEPFGEENSKPLFATFSVSKKSAPRKIGTGFSLWLTEGSTTYEGLVYDKDILEIINFADSFDIVYSLEKNNYHGIERLVIRDARFTCKI
ncbi:MAG: single-stranded-DNA-specific exonuclease RecJ [Candidatus Omnitrophica bacterium]|nr:single-stranded-DNA-specific exonuclease RecJ [Candidatus Omnitrophota bacterium]